MQPARIVKTGNDSFDMQAAFVNEGAVGYGRVTPYFPDALGNSAGRARCPAYFGEASALA